MWHNIVTKAAYGRGVVGESQVLESQSFQQSCHPWLLPEDFHGSHHGQDQTLGQAIETE